MKHEPLLKAASFSGSRVQPFDGTRRYLSTGDLQESTTSFVEVTYADKPSRADISVRSGDVLFARMKGTKKVLEIDRSLAGIIVSTGFAVLRPTEKCNGKFLSIYLKSDDFERQKEKYCSGAIQPAITNAGIKKITVPFPPLDDQKRIAHLLGKVEGLIARRKQHLQQLDDLLKSVFLEMFGDPVRNEKGWEKRIFREVTSKFSDGPFGSNLKSSHYRSAGIRVIRLNNIGIWEFNDYDKAYVSQQHYEEVLKKHTCVPGDVLIGTMGDPNIRACLLPESIPVAINKADCVLCRVNPKYLSPYYILGLLNSHRALNLVSNLLHGQTRTRVSMGQLAKLEIPIPPIDLQNQFAAIVKTVEGIKSLYQQSLAELESLYGALSQKAFKGELDLSRVPLTVEATTEGTSSTEELKGETHEMVQA